MNVLVVDDSSAVTKLYAKILQGEGCRVATAGSAEEALQKISAGLPRLVFVDYSLDGEDGADVVRRLKSEFDKRGERPLLVGLTSYSTKAPVLQSFVEDLDGCEEKPSDVLNLTELFRKYLTTSR